MTSTPRNSMRNRLLIGGAALAVVIAAVLGVVLTRGDDSIPAGATLVRMEDIAFDPTAIVLDERTNTLVIDNADDEAHTFTITDLGVDEYIGPRARRTISLEIPKAGVTHELHCTVTGHAAMVGIVRRTP